MSESTAIPATIHIPPFQVPQGVIKELQEIAERMEAAAERFEKAIREETVSWSEAEAADLLDISEVTLRKLRIEGRIAFSPVGRKARYTKKHLADFLEGNTKPARGQKRPASAG